MNALKTINTLFESLENTKHWRAPQYACDQAISSEADRIIAAGLECARLKAERIADLAANGPKVSVENAEVTITLLRPNALGVMQEEFHNFGEYRVKMQRTDDAELLKKLGVKGPPAESGHTYFIHASPGDWGQMPFGIHVTREECFILEALLE